MWVLFHLLLAMRHMSWLDICLANICPTHETTNVSILRSLCSCIALVYFVTIYALVISVMTEKVHLITISTA